MKLFKNRCYNGGKQHKFEAAYDETPRTGNFKGCFDAAELRSLMVTRTYVKHVCAWCGKEVTR